MCDFKKKEERNKGVIYAYSTKEREESHARAINLALSPNFFKRTNSIHAIFENGTEKIVGS